MIPLILIICVLTYHLLRGDLEGFAKALGMMIFGFVVVTLLHMIF